MRSRRSTRLVAGSLTALVVLAACSDDRPVASDTVATAPLTIQVTGGAAPTAAEGALVREVAGDASSSMVAPDGKMAPWWGAVEYELAAELPSLDTPGDGWRYVAQPDLDRGAAARIAEAFGVVGELEALPSDWGGGWRIGPGDGSAPSVMFGADGTGWWSYSAMWANAVEAEPIDAEGRLPEPVEMTPPEGIPTAAEAEALARALFDAMGIDPASVEVEAYADEWSAGVTMWHLLDGRRSGYASSVGFGENAMVTWAGGMLNAPERVAGFERIGTAAGFDRLAAGGGPWWGGIASPRADIALPYPGDGGEGVEPEVITLQIVEVREAWWTLYDVDGTVWLVPGYAFIDSDGGEHLVPAVSDELIQPVEPVGVEPGVAEPGFDPEQPVSSEPADLLVGLIEEQAVEVAAEMGFDTRVVERDGESFPVTADYRQDRINLVVNDGVVAKASIG